MKRCARCGDVKSLDAFNRHSQSRDGRFAYCRECYRAYQVTRAAKAGRVRSPRRARVPGKKRCPDCEDYLPLEAFGKNRGARDGLTGYCRRHQGERRRASIARLHGSERHYHLVRRYGVSAADVDHMLEQQAGLCAICRQDLGDKPHVDHDHETGRVRSLLCFNCNGGLGQFADDPQRLRAAAAYVEQHRGVKALPPGWPTVTVSAPQPGEEHYYAVTHGPARA